MTEKFKCDQISATGAAVACDSVRDIKPFIFEPYLKSVLWGGDKIAAFKGIAVDRHDIGESWEISGVAGHESVVAAGADKGTPLHELIDRYRGDLVGKSVYERFGNTFPLLVKFIDAKRDLSLQVHPDDALAMRRHGTMGKTEMWYILDAEADARIYAGMREEIDGSEYERRVADNTILDVVACHTSEKGDLFFLPAGRIHAIGAGNMLVEIQETSDITYRVYDYGRLDANGNARELHVELAKDAIDYEVYDGLKSSCTPRVNGEAQLVRCSHFDTRLVTVDGECRIDLSATDSFCVVICIDGELVMTDDSGSATELRRGLTLLMPAVATSLCFTGKGSVITATM